ncbi:PD-(D/E)XK motif protein [Roseomonas populi]|uniref:PD-(D/E)XK motif protein n=1 Tax=Roseomonas populi TaxID=3121582 RepID=A0ABT1X4W7_9PROT|nr:PD-(D/E)XK motif protein [Roseomonas pecuniae]MCR0983141.1 PD-(D/E)XK motif protein [Roseomonas pecuniae]
MVRTMSIEPLWNQLATGGVAAQTRIDARHPHDIYADIVPPGAIGLLVLLQDKPPPVETMRAIAVEVRTRVDGRWTLRLTLNEPRLRPVFAALCDDIVACTREGIAPGHLGGVVVQRIQHWRALLDREAGGLGESVLQGLIGELLVLRDLLLPTLGPLQSVASWRGPAGAPQDFILPDGARVEVKTIRAHANEVSIANLAQLDGLGDPLTLIAVRVENSQPGAAGAVTAPGLIAGTRLLLAGHPQAERLFDIALGQLRWHEHPSHHELALRPMAVDPYPVGPAFPKLIRSTVPSGIVEASYRVLLPGRKGSGLVDAP